MNTGAVGAITEVTEFCTKRIGPVSGTKKLERHITKTLELVDLSSTRSIDAVVPTSVHYSRQTSNASAACQDAAPLDDSMSYTLVM